MQTTFQTEGIEVTDIKARNYFSSIYTTEKGKVIFEIATNGPGFELDEKRELLGTELKLLEQYEHKRQGYEASLPKLDR